MKPILILITIIFTVVSYGADSSTYTLLTNKLSKCIAYGSWRYETNGLARIRKITLPIEIDNQFSDEIISSLRKWCPREWNAAISSSGNTANPNVTSLRPFFNDAVLRTPTISRFQSVAEKMVNPGVVLRIYHEKLSYTAVDFDRPDRGNRIIRCFLWVEVSDIINKASSLLE